MNLIEKSRKIFTYKYYEDIERVYSVLTNKYIINERIFKDYIFNVIIKNNESKENELEGMIILFNWKNKYDIEILIDENENKYENKNIGILFTKIKEYKNPIKINIYFYWNSCEYYTLMLIEIIIYDENIKNIIFNQELSKEIIEKFLTLPEEKMNEEIEHYKASDPALAEELEQIRDEEAYFKAFGDTVVVSGQ